MLSLMIQQGTTDIAYINGIVVTTNIQTQICRWFRKRLTDSVFIYTMSRFVLFFILQLVLKHNVLRRIFFYPEHWLNMRVVCRLGCSL